MKYRRSLLMAAEDLGASGTKVIDVNIQKPISRIEVKFQTTKSKHGMDAGQPANILKVELVDGSKVLHSLNGYESQALAYYNRGKISMEHGQHLGGSSETDLYVIDFGRFLWDTELAFVPMNFSNPQLRITFDEDLSDDGVTVNECEIWADIFDLADISPIGFLAAIEHYAYTCGANNSFELIAMPEDRTYRQILLRAYLDSYEPWYVIDEARFDEGTLDNIPFDFTNLETYYRMMKSTWPMLQIPFQGISASGGKNFYICPTDYYANIIFGGINAAPDTYLGAASARGGMFPSVSATNQNFWGTAIGWLPWHTFQFPMGRQDVIDDWYDPAGKKPRLRLRASTGATSGIGQVVIEELHRY